ncbi:37S ribosomal protein S22 [Dissophora globulifera]|nr:37S ribosomal protein S22 [Dissophora globulifera]
MQARQHVSRLADSLVHRFPKLSLVANEAASAKRGYARVARARPRTPSSSITSPSSSPSASATTSNGTPFRSQEGITNPTLGSPRTPNIKLPSNFKLAKLDALEDYDPNMVIFLDKHGNVKMIPHDDRVNGQTREEYDSSIEAGDLVNDGQHFQRGSKEAEYGRKRIGQVEMPSLLQDAIRSVIDEHDKSLIRTDALRLYGSLRSTGGLDGEGDLQTKRLKSGAADMKAKDNQPIPAHILEYGHRESIAYIAAMAPTTYSAIVNVLEEVHRRVPDLQPKTFLDFGTGPGTAIWAANEVWDTVQQYTGIDASLPMLETAEGILSELSSTAPVGTSVPNVAFKPFFSHGSQATKHDIVMSAFSLSELTTSALRKSTLEHLWESTNDMLILIDRGTPSGFRVLAEAREQILGLDVGQFKPKPKYDAYGNQLPEEEPPARELAHVLAPCPHDKVCPVYASLSRDSQWCHFSQKVQRPDFLRKTKHSKENYEDSKYTYVVLRKGARPTFTQPASASISAASVKTQTPTEPTVLSSEPSDATSHTAATPSKKFKKPPPPPPVTYDNDADMFAASHNWSRIIMPPLKKDGHVVIDTCAADGYLERIIIPKSQGKIPYRDARKAMWGDLFPHAPKNKPVRKDAHDNIQDAEGLDQDEAHKQKRMAPGMSAEMLRKRTKQKEKKQSRRKVSLDGLGGAGDSRKGRKGDEDITIDL